jgi:hypothetical protein
MNRTIALVTSLVILPPTIVAQRPVVQPIGAGSTAMSLAEALLRDGRRADASDVLGGWLALHADDGKAWHYLGRIHLADAQRWHREGHENDPPASMLLDFAGAAFEAAQQLLTDSGTVYRVLVAIERATLRIESDGWETGMSRPIPADELPLPPVLSELGSNLLASCPAGGVLVTGSLVETAAAWGHWLIAGNREDLVLLRPDMYSWDARYRVRMAEALGVSIDLDLPSALSAAARQRPICLAPAVDPLIAPGLQWRPTGLVLSSGLASGMSGSPALDIHQLAITGLAGSVWSAAARDLYELAARRNRTICERFALADSPRPPSIPSCRE